MSNAHDLLRRYLEQRREMGESEFSLDGVTVEDALRMIGNAKGMAAPASAPTAAPSSAPVPARTPAAPPTHAAEPEITADWRAALRAQDVPSGDAKPTRGPSAPPTAPPPAPTSAAPSPAPAPVVPREGDRRFAFDTSVAAEPPTSGAAEDGLVVGQTGGAHLSGDVAAAQSLDDIARLVSACAACGLGALKTRDVVGEGNPEADFVVVGEAPGEQEDLSGRPFVGASGQLLTKILAAIDLPREQVYICNVIKHRPPGNRNPTPAEVAACSPFLLRQLELVKPKVILALGTFAAQTLLRTKDPIGRLRGRVHRYYGVPLVVTYHPAALLRNPTWKRPTWEDVQLARRILDRASGA